MRVAVFGLPKTGTTGLYGLIKNGMSNAGHNPVCSFEPPGIAAYQAFFERASADTPFLTKAMVRGNYFKQPELIENFSHKVMIVRDPRDRAISRTLFRVLGQRVDNAHAISKFVELLKQKEADPKSISLKGITDAMDQLGIGKSDWQTIGKRMNFQINTIKEFGFFTLLYEDFVDKSYANLADYLGIELAGAKASNQNWLGHITRSKSRGDWRNWFTREDVEFLRPIFKPYMDAFGYEDDWELNETAQIESENASEYVTRSYAKRQREFGLMDSDGEKAIASDEDLQFYLGRAADGRTDDIWRVGNYKLDQAESLEAVQWFEIGFLLGNLKCTKALKKLITSGILPEQPRSKLCAHPPD